MICDVMLDRMLEAEPAELEGVGDTVVARHVRTCDRCRAVARTLHAQTRELASTVAGAPNAVVAHAERRRVGARRPRYATQRSVGAALVAASLVMLLLPRGETPEADAVGPRVAGNDVPSATGVPAVQQGIDAPMSVPAGAHQFAPRAFARAQAVAAVPVAFTRSESVFDVARTSVDAVKPDVVVSPPPGVRAAVMRGSAAGVTVIWLH